MNYNWDWSVLISPPYVNWLAIGFGWTIIVSIASWIIALIVGAVIGTLRTLPSPIARGIGTIYVEIFRNIPLMVQIFLFYFVLPEVVPEPIGRWLKRDLPYPEVSTAIFSIGLYMGCRIAEQVRAGIETSGAGQRQAGLASGLRLWQVYRLILLPLAFRQIVPALTNEILNTFKNSSLALTIGVLELTSQSRALAEYSSHPIEAFAAATLIYVVVSHMISFGMAHVEKWAHVAGTLADGGTR